MKTLVLIRHSNAEDEYSDDFERVLTTKGIELAKKVASELQIKPTVNSIFVSSEAPRAIQTAEIFLKSNNLSERNLHSHIFLYKYFNLKQFLQFLEINYNKENDIWLFCHNPMLAEVSYSLSDGKIFSFPKCAVAYFEISAENWKFANKLNSELKLFINPK